MCASHHRTRPCWVAVPSLPRQRADALAGTLGQRLIPMRTSPSQARLVPLSDPPTHLPRCASALSHAQSPPVVVIAPSRSCPLLPRCARSSFVQPHRTALLCSPGLSRLGCSTAGCARLPLRLGLLRRHP